MHLFRLTTGATALVLLAACEAPSAMAPEPALEAALSPAGAPTLVTGSGHVPAGSGQRVFTFHAKDENGSASGSYTIRLTEPGLFFTVDVSCLAVDGNTAWVAGHISATNAGFVQIGTVSSFYAIDNGEGANAPADVVSTAGFNAAAGQDVAFCNDRPLLLPSFPIEQGNVQVR